MLSNKIIIVLDNIRSAWNVGAIMRTCDAIGAGVILVGYTPRPEGETKKLITKTAIGAQEWVSWQHFDHPNEVFAAYSHASHIGIEITKESQDIFDFLDSNELDKQVFLWFGNEIHGLNKNVTDNCDFTIHLQMLGKKESLNVASTVCASGYLFLRALSKK